MKKSNWAFLTSTRFWALVIGAAATWLFSDGYITEALRNCLVIIAGGFITIKTVDRVTDKATG